MNSVDVKETTPALPFSDVIKKDGPAYSYVLQEYDWRGWYISPEPLAQFLSAPTTLEWLSLDIQSPTTHSKRRSRRHPPITRSLLSALTFLEFKGVSEYLEVLAARIHVPQLDVFKPSQILHSIPFFLSDWPNLDEIYGTNGLSSHHLDWTISSKGVDWQVFLAAQMYSQNLPLCFIVEQLNIGYNNCWTVPGGIRPDDIHPMRWTEPFAHFCAESGITHQVFPALQNVYIRGGSPDRAAQQGMQSFVTARQHSNRPIIVQRE
ncbi:hypothetical protein BGW80DRAFT_1461548 [Lactifluus volemus]|nr:hypothetical protein BGW80DRAFT_1461548 [Lactifluus volemus]